MKNIPFYFVFLLLTGACQNASPTAGSDPAAPAPEGHVRLTTEQLKNAGVVTGRAERRQVTTALPVNGLIDVPPQNLVSVSFPLGGYLKSTDLLPGMPVRKGQRIAVLEDPQYIQLQQDYLMGKARLQYLEAEYARQKDLQTGQAGSGKALQQAEADYTAQRILVKALAEKLLLIGLDPATLDAERLSRSVRVVSPIDGFVSAVHVNTGKYVNPTDVLFELVDPRDIHLNLTVFEKDVPALRIGQRVRAWTNDRPNEPHLGHIILISRNIDERRAAEVHCHFDRYDARLLPGMYMRADIEVVDQQALAVPESAVVRWENRHYVFVERAPTEFDLTEVSTGASSGGYVQVSAKSGPPLDTAVLVLENAYALLMKMKNTAEE